MKNEWENKITEYTFTHKKCPNGCGIAFYYEENENVIIYRCPFCDEKIEVKKIKEYIEKHFGKQINWYQFYQQNKEEIDEAMENEKRNSNNI